MTLLRSLKAALAALVCALSVAPAAAAVPIYPTPGTQNPFTYTFTAADDGNLVAYFAGVSAGFQNVLGARVNGVDRGLSSLNSLVSAGGDSFDFGAVSLGDLLEFYIEVSPDPMNPPEYILWSDPALNAGIRHVWSAPFTGGDFGIPDGTFIVFEDLQGGGDFNYADMGFVVTNTRVAATAAVPEPATWAMMIIGFGLIGASMRSRLRAARLGLA